MPNASQQPDPPAVLANMPPRRYQPDDIATYEAIRELAYQALALLSAQRSQLEQHLPAHLDTITKITNRQQRLATQLRTLDPADTAGVAHLRAECVAILSQEQPSDQ